MSLPVQSAKLTDWLARFQPELRDDIENGSKIDCTRKPGFYFIRETISTERNEWELPDADYLLWYMKRNDNLLPLLAITAANEHTGLELHCPNEDTDIEDCPCNEWELDYTKNAHKTVAKHGDVIADAITVVDPDEFYDWASELDALKHLFYDQERKHCIDHVFLTRKSGARHIDRYGYRYEEPTVYAHHVYNNPDLLNAITFLAALDLEKSTLVFTNETADEEAQS